MSERRVLRPFPYAADHIRAEQLATGDVRDFPADILPGLVAGGYVEGPGAVAEKPAQAASAEPAAETPAELDAAPESASAPARPARKRA